MNSTNDGRDSWSSVRLPYVDMRSKNRSMSSRDYEGASACVHVKIDMKRSLELQA